MKKLYKSLLFLLLVVGAIMFSACDKDEPTEGHVTISFNHVFGDDAFSYGTNYTTSQGEEFTPSLLRYYISNIQLEKMDGTRWSEEESYHLINHGDDATKSITLSGVPTGEYHKVHFMVGVDSLRNVSGAQEGALSPPNGMFWSWNTGYIFFKVEGETDANEENVIFHIGGFSGDNNAIQLFDQHVHDPMLMVDGESVPKVKVQLDVAQLFGGSTAVNLDDMHKVHMPGAMAKKLSDNFINGFSIQGVE